MVDTEKLTPDAIRRFDRAVPQHFTLQTILDDGPSELPCRQILRLLPGKRITFFSEHKGIPVVVKCFMDPAKWHFHLQRELKGHRALTDAALYTPRKLASASNIKEKHGLVIYQQLVPSQSLQAVWNQCRNESEQASLLQDTCKTIASMHNQGLIHEDIHLDNFLVYGNKTHIIDGDGITSKSSSAGNPIDSQTALSNLSMFFAQLKPQNDHLIACALPSYIQHASAGINLPPIASFETKVREQRLWRRSNYLKKISRDCSEVRVAQTYSKFLVCKRSHWSPDFEHFTLKIDCVIANNPLLKDGNSQTVAKIEFGGRKLVIKRYNMKNLGHWLRRCFRPSRAYTSWIAAHGLDFLGLVTPAPIAFMEARYGPLRRKAYYITEFSEGKDAVDYFSDPALNDHDARIVADQFIAIFSLLKDQLITHGDMKAKNFLVNNGKVSIIDLDALRFHDNNKTFQPAFKKDMERFMKNWLDKPAIKALFEDKINQLLEKTRPLPANQE